MGNKVSFRDFEIRDVDFIYKAKNDKRVNETIVGDFSNFSYDDAIQWVEGCMKKNENYKYWAICTNDEFQNIVGWCGLSSINLIDSSAWIRTIVIYDPKYRDTVTWFKTCNYILKYAFEELGINRLYGDCLTTNTFHYQFLKSYPYMIIEQRHNALLKGGLFYDVVVFQITREEYEGMKGRGLLEYERVQSYMKDQFRSSDRKFADINDFIEEASSILNSSITPDTKFRDLEEWSSLLAVNLVAIAENGFHTNFDMNELNKCDTLRDLYEMVKNRGSQLN